MPITDDYQLQDIFSRVCGSTAESSDSARSHDLGKYNHCRETYKLGVHQWDYTQLMYTIDSYDLCRQWKLPSIPSHDRKLYPPHNSDKDLHQDVMKYECSTGWQVGGCMSSGVEIRRNWGPRLGSGGNGSIEFHNSGLEESYQLGVLSSVSSLLYSIHYYFIGSRPGINGVGTGFTTSRSQSMEGGVFPSAGFTEKRPYGANR